MTAFALAVTAVLFAPLIQRGGLPYPIVDTGQTRCYDESAAIDPPEEGAPFSGQDAQYTANPPSYRDDGNGTVSDLVTGLSWTKDPGEQKTLAQALEGASRCRVGGHDDWRLPTIKELYSLILFSGVDPDPRGATSSGLTPFIDDSVFTGFRYGDAAKGQRVIDSQYATCTRYVSTTMQGNETMFGVNFADGRIKGYPVRSRRGEGRYYVLYVRGNPEYGKNVFEDGADGTVTDAATGLTWMKSDSGRGLDWRAALEYAETLELAGHDDWRLPTAKELQSLVDYSRSPDTTDSAAIDPIFEATPIENEGGERDFGCYWTSTSHRRGRGAGAAVYVAFGRALGFMRGRRAGDDDYRLLDVHGAGAQRSDPKAGDASRFPHGRGPQGDVIRIENLVRCVRGGGAKRLGAGSEPAAPAPATLERRPEDSEPVEKSSPAPGATDPSTHPNFVLILTDDMGWTGLGVLMDDSVKDSVSDFYRTPHIAKLAEEGMRFTRAYSPAALCTPSRASILTGKTPARLHITSPGGGGRAEAYRELVPPKQLRRLPTEEITIAEALAGAGYASAHLGKWHLGRSDPGDHGFDVHDGVTANGGAGNLQDPNPKDIFGLTERAIAFVREQARSGTPFYLQVSHYAVHEPFEALRSSKEKFAALSRGERHTDVDFAAMTFDLDAGVGALLAELDALELTGGTYVVLMSDNGAAGGPRRPQNAPLNLGKGSFHEGGIRVPLIVRGPGVESGGFCRENVVGYDLLPTFCEWAGVERPAGLDGVSLVPLLEGHPERFERPEKALLFHYPHYGQGPRQKPQVAILLGEHKLIRDFESGTSSLFDLSRDLGERNDLAEREPERTAELERLLDRRLKEVGAQLPTPNPAYDPDAKPAERGRRASGDGGE